MRNLWDIVALGSWSRGGEAQRTQRTLQPSGKRGPGEKSQEFKIRKCPWEGPEHCIIYNSSWG